MELVLTHPGGKSGRNHRPGARGDGGGNREPGWANGLRRLYNSVLSEPLPDSFDDLLKKLDQGNDE